ncbi:MAG: hypothetical protein KUL88_02540 [Rhizobium sp.]|nr:hypothetical protein [Rhizobium sp.]
MNSEKHGLLSRLGVRYEVALDVLGALVAHYAELVDLERDWPVPDALNLRQAGALQAALRQTRDELDPRDADAIEAVIAHYGPHARRLTLHLERPDPLAERAAQFRQANASLALEGWT